MLERGLKRGHYACALLAPLLLTAGLLTAGPARSEAPPQAAAAINPSAVFGDWLTGDRRGVIRITACGGGICGQIVGQDWPAGTKQPVDNKGRIECGQTILHGTRTGALLWGGQIVDPDDGSAYRATYRLVGADTLALRGYILLPLFGQTQDWTRFRGAIGSACRFTPPAGVGHG